MTDRLGLVPEQGEGDHGHPVGPAVGVRPGADQDAVDEWWPQA